MKSKRKVARNLRENSSSKNKSASAPNPRDNDNSNDDASIAQSSHTSPLFSLILDRSLDPLSRIVPPQQKFETLPSGMVLLKKFISIDDQAWTDPHVCRVWHGLHPILGHEVQKDFKNAIFVVKIVNICEEFGTVPGGFYQAGGKKLHMMCFGRNWDPHEKYDARRSDCSEAPPIPDQFLSCVETALQKAQEEDPIPSMQPDICIVNFYTTNDKLGLHQDRDESSDSLDKGLPVVSISIGDSAQFLYGPHKDAKKAKKVLLNSGDVLIFGGESRHIFHGITEIYANSAPHSLLEKSILRPGRLNLTFRQY